MSIIFCLWLLVFFQISSLSADDLLVTTKQGVIKGQILTTFSNLTYKSFQGVPYAKPPVGPLRFQAPQPPESWKGVLDVSSISEKRCYSTSHLEGESEDCLYLNVHTPIFSQENKTSLPVLLAMHSGGYTHGAGIYSMYGPDYLIRDDIIVVTINYRLGPFAFLSTGDAVIPGNTGHKDQAAAIRWTFENINRFGGDPRKITISGESAGAASAGYQLLYKGNKGIFRGAILQSGSALSPWSFMNSTRAKEYAFDLAKQIDGSVDLQNDTTKLKEFLLSVDGNIINMAMASTEIRSTLPTIEVEHDGAFITKSQYELLKAGDFIRVPILIGTTSEEEIHQAGDLNNLEKKLKQFEANPQKFIPSDFIVKSGISSKLVGENIKNLYLKGVPDDEKMGHIIQFLSHTTYTMPMIKYADLASNFTSVYFSVFSYDGDLGNVSVTIKGASKVDHSETGKYLWKSDWNANLSRFPAADVLTLNRMTRISTNFVKFLNPTPNKSDLFENLTWPKFTQGKFKYVDIDTNLTIKNNPKSPYYEAWTQFYEDWAKKPLTTF